MNKKKLAGLLLASTLLVGATAGSFAYFTDQEEITTKVGIVLGDVDVNITDEEWVVATTGTNADMDEDAFTVNVRPGEVFTRNVLVESFGSLDTVINIGLAKDLSSKVIGQKEDGTDIIFTDVFNLHVEGLGEHKVLVNGAGIDVVITLTVKSELGNEFQNAEFDLDYILGEDAPFIIISGEQAHK